MWNKIVHVVKNITVEPPLILFLVAHSLQFTTSLAVLYEKVCYHLYKDEWICSNLNINNTLNDEEQTVQQINSKWQFYNNVIFYSVSLLSVFVYGYLTDKYSRKVPLIAPFIGSGLDAAVYLLCAVYIQSPLAVVLLSPLFASLGGGRATMLLGTSSYISSIVPAEQKTSRISIMYACSSIASLITLSISGVLLEATGYVFVFSFCIIVHLTGLLYVVFLINDKRDEGNCEKDKSKQGDEVNQKDSCGTLIYSLFASFKQVFQTTFKQRLHNKRKHILIIIGIALGEQVGTAASVNYLFLKHPPLSFTQTMYGFYSGSSALARAVCLFAIIPLLKHVHVGDAPLLLMGIASLFAEQVIMSFSTEVWMPYTATWIGILSADIFVCVRALLSLNVAPDEVGKIFGFVIAVESIGGLLASALYNFFLYPTTIETFAGACYIVGCLILILPLSLSIWLWIDMNKLRSKKFQDTTFDELRKKELSSCTNEEFNEATKM